MAAVSTKKNRPHRMRRWVYAPLAMAVAAGAVCTGAGVGSAATGADSGAPTMITWRFHNGTVKLLKMPDLR
ncbi:hypothetical protein R3Q06_30580 [Rhodococcus erythropolis]|uniref:hypothetical protein n=1 Tax=Rhodococcus erythropolis TaxID=1833 RepID=UPI002949F246|nr:hypothetical protein [Rhodococcus erythropolis]MDV6277841.1 hypothetical protein [Rhodococcus erythropolis]